MNVRLMTKKKLLLLGLLGLLGLLVFGSVIASAQRPSNEVSLKLQSDKTVVSPGDTVNLLITLNHKKGYNTYWINPGGSGIATTFDWVMPDNFSVEDLLWEIPKVKPSNKQVDHIYTDKSYVIAKLKIPDDAKNGVIEIGLKGEWLECTKIKCSPASGETALKLKVGDKSKTNSSVVALVNQVKKQQPKSLDSWKIEYGGDDNIFALKLTPLNGANLDPGKLYFYEASKDANLDPLPPHIAKAGKSWVVSMLKKNKGIDSADVEGFVYAPNGWSEDGDKVKALSLINKVKSTTDLSTFSAGFFATKDEAEHAEAHDSAAEDVAAGAKLYDKEAKPEYVGGWKPNIWTGIGGIFLAGIILNLMPCVFPVLAIKIMGFVSQAGEAPGKVKAHGLFFGLGVLISMLILAAIILQFDLNWGDQMQIPAFVAGITILMFILGLNMAGVFEFGTSLTNVGGGLQNKSGVSGSFFSGVLTTLIATPCSGPFLGVLMAFALSQESKLVSLLIFTFFAFGIAFPYVFLSFFPKLIEKLPPPGKWMEVLKKGMSFALFATVVFFLSAFAVQTGYDGTKWLLFGLVVIGLALWIYGSWGTPFVTKAKRFVVGYGMTLVALVIAFVMVRHAVKQEAPKLAGVETQSFNITNDDGSTESFSLTWQKWYPGVMEYARTKKRIVWVDYTADW